MSTTTIPDMTDLTDDGDTIDLGNGLSLRLRIETDMDTDVNDFDCYGKVEWTSGGYGLTPNRPDDFTGAARIIARDRGSALWWQPWTGATEQEANDFLPTIRERVEYGFYLIGLELRETVTDSRGGSHTVELDTAWLGGVDDTSAETLADILPDLWYQVEGN
jgi:hypothetical protein